MVRNPLSMDGKGRLQQWLQIHPGWSAVWLEGIDPPRRLASTANVTVLLVANQGNKKNGLEEFGFILASSRIAAKKKEREKECAKELTSAFDQLPIENLKAWCQMPEAEKAKRDVEPGDLERVTEIARQRVPNVVLELPEPTAFVLVSSMPWGPHEKSQGPDPDLPVLDRVDAGFAELLKEARRVSGLVRKQWHVAIVWAKPGEQKDELRPFTLGVGLATDRSLARARAIHAAEVRAGILTEAMFTKNVTPKSLPDGPVGNSKS